MADEKMLRVLRVWAADAAAFAEVLAEQDPSWGAETFPSADGHVALCGSGMYVNAAIGVGLERPLSRSEWTKLEERSAAVGVEPSVEVSPATLEGVRDQLAMRGYQHSGTRLALSRAVGTADAVHSSDPAFVIEPANGALLPMWQAVSLEGWGHVTPDAVASSNAFARAAAVVDEDRTLLVSDVDGSRPIGCASLTVRDAVATLGGMSTVPSERGRGVQSALIAHRLRLAFELGCDIVTSTVVPGGTSERNLLRQRFEPWFVLDTYTKSN